MIHLIKSLQSEVEQKHTKKYIIEAIVLSDVARDVIRTMKFIALLRILWQRFDRAGRSALPPAAAVRRAQIRTLD